MSAVRSVSVKSDVGRLDTAASIAGLLKTVLADQVAASLAPLPNFSHPYLALKLEQSPFTIPVLGTGMARRNALMRASPPLVLAAPTARPDRRLAARRAQRAPANTDSGRKKSALLLSAAATALRRLATDYTGAGRELRMPALWPSQPCTRRRLNIPFRSWRRH